MLKSITGLNSKPLTDSQSSIPASNKDFGRDPRAQRFTELRDPRSARVAVSELRDPRDPRSHQLRDPRLQAPPVAVESSSLRDPRLHGNSTDSNSSEDVKLPFTSKEVKSGIASCAGAGFSKSDTDTVAKTAYHPIPYRLRAVTISPPVYSTLALSSKTDPKLVQLDPRLKRQLTSNDPRARRISSRLAVGRVTKEMSDDIMQMDASVDEKLDRSGSRHSETFATIQSPPPLPFTSDTPFRIDEDKHRDEDSSKLKNSVEDDGKSENVPPAGSFKGFGTVAMPSTPPLSPLTELRVKENEQTVDTDLTSNLKDVINKSDSVKSVKKPISSPHFGRHMLGAIAVPLTPRGNSIKKVGLGNGGGTKKFAFPTKTEEHKVDAKTTLPPLTMKTEVADGKDIHSTPRVRMEEDNVEESKVVSPSESKGSHDCCERESGKESNSTLTPFGNLETTKSSTSESNIESDLVDDSVKRIEGAENPDETKTPGAVVVAAERETGANTKADIYTFDDDDDDDDDTCDDLVIVEEKVEPPKSIVQTKHDAESFVAEGVRSGKGRKTREKGCAEDSKTAPVDVSPVVSDKPQKEKNESKGQLSSDTKLTLSRGKEESTSKTQSKPKKSPKQEQKNKGDGPGKRKRKMGTPEPEVICDDNEPTYKSKPRAAKAKTLAACSTKKSSGRRTTSSKSPVSTATNVTSPPQTEPQQQLRVPPLKIRRTNSTMPTVVVESGEMVTTKTTDSTSLKEIFKTIDPTASPFC